MSVFDVWTVKVTPTVCITGADDMADGLAAMTPGERMVVLEHMTPAQKGAAIGLMNLEDRTAIMSLVSVAEKDTGALFFSSIECTIFSSSPLILSSSHPLFLFALFALYLLSRFIHLMPIPSFPLFLSQSRVLSLVCVLACLCVQL